MPHSFEKKVRCSIESAVSDGVRTQMVHLHPKHLSHFAAPVDDVIVAPLAERKKPAA
jgi:hypothetical protein